MHPHSPIKNRCLASARAEPGSGVAELVGPASDPAAKRKRPASRLKQSAGHPAASRGLSRLPASS